MSDRESLRFTRVNGPLMARLQGASNQAQAPAELRAALATIARHVDDYADRACLPGG